MVHLSAWTLPSNGELRRYWNGWQEAVGLYVLVRLGVGVVNATYKGQSIPYGLGEAAAGTRVWLSEGDTLQLDGYPYGLDTPVLSREILRTDLITILRAAGKTAR